MVIRAFGTFVVRSLRIKMSRKPEIVFVLGAPGSGKGTQCDHIVSNFGFVHLSAGDLLREERNTPGSQYGDLIETYIKEGSIIPVAITLGLLEKAMTKSGSSRFLIDGFPRNQDNLDGWNDTMKEKVDLLFVLFLECPQEVCTERCLKRGAEGSGRSDDNMDSLRKRFDTYMNMTMPVIKHYETQGLVRTILADHEPEQVFEQVSKIFGQLKSN